MWTDGYNNTDFIDAPAAPLVRPFPVSVWQIDPEVDFGEPYIPLFPDWVRLHVNPVKQHDYICVFPMNTEKTGFSGNGLAILTPTECREAEALCGGYAITLMHPLDPEGRWKFLIEHNIIKCAGQLYTIMQVRTDLPAGGGSVTVYAEHISYQLSDPYIFPISFNFSSQSAQSVIDFGTSQMYSHAEPGQTRYAFQINSDMTFSAPYFFPKDRGMTMLELLIGSGGIMEVCGGELHRDNFNLSLNTRKEGAKDNAFDIRLGANLAAAVCTVDITTFCSYFRAYDNFGDWWAVAWYPSEFLLNNFPHHVVRSATFNYDEPDMERLAQDGMAEFKRNAFPVICYDIQIKDMINCPEFAELSGMPEYKVGNTGRIYDERLGGAITLKITETETDRITGETVRVVFGNRQSFVRSASAPVIVGVDPIPQEAEGWLIDKNGAGLIDKDGKKLVRRASLGNV